MFFKLLKPVTLMAVMIAGSSLCFAQSKDVSNAQRCENTKVSAGVEQTLCINLTSKNGDREEATYCSYFGQNLDKSSVSSPGVPKPFYHSFNDSVDLVTKYARVDNRTFKTRVAAVPNAAAIISRGSDRHGKSQEIKYLLFNQNFMTSIKGYARNRRVYKPSAKSVSKSGRKTSRKSSKKQIRAGVRDDWLVMNVVAHEVGHHLAGHTLKLGNQPYNELQADWFAGFMLEKLGASLREAREMLTLGAPCGTLTHPERKDRIAAVTSGWVQACEEDADCNIARINISNSGADKCIEEKNTLVQSTSLVKRKPTASKYTSICKLRERNYLIKNNDVFKNSYGYDKQTKVWKHVWKLDRKTSFNGCKVTTSLLDGARCLNKNGTILEGTLLGEAIPVGVCAPCAPGVCPSS